MCCTCSKLALLTGTALDWIRLEATGTVTLIELRRDEEMVIGSVHLPLEQATAYNRQDNVLTLDLDATNSQGINGAMQITLKTVRGHTSFKPDSSAVIGDLCVKVIGKSFRHLHARKLRKPLVQFNVDEQPQFSEELHGEEQDGAEHAIRIRKNQFQAVLQVYDAARPQYKEVLGSALLPLQMVQPGSTEVQWVDVVDYISQTVLGYLRLLVTSRLSPPGFGIVKQPSAMTYYDSVAVTPMRIELDNFSDSESKDIFVMIEVTGQQSSTRTIMEAQIVVSWQQQFVFAVTPEVKQRGKLGVYNFKTAYDQLLATCEFDIPHNWEADNAYKGLKLDLISPMTQHPCGLAYVFIQPAPAALQLKMPMAPLDMPMSKFTGPRPDKVCVNVFKATDVIGLNGQPGMYDAKVVVTVAENSLVTAEVRSFAIEPFWDSELVFPLPADCESFKVRLYEHDQILGEAEASLRGFLEDQEHYCCIEMRMISPTNGHQTAFLDIIVKEAPVAPAIEEQPVAPLQKKPTLSGDSHRIVDINVLQAQRLHMGDGQFADRSMYSNLFVQMLLGEKDAQTNLGHLRDGMDGNTAHEVEVPMAIWKENFSMEVPMRTHDLMFILFDNSTSHPAGDQPTELGSAILNLPAAFPHHQVDTWLYILDPESKQTERAILRVALRFRWLDSCYPQWIIPEFYHPNPRQDVPPIYFSMHPLPLKDATVTDASQGEVFMLRVCVGHNFAHPTGEHGLPHSAGIEEAPPSVHKPFCIITINDQHIAQTRAFSAPRSWSVRSQGVKTENPYFPVWNADFYFEMPKGSTAHKGTILVYSDKVEGGHDQGGQSVLIGQAELPLDKLMRPGDNKKTPVVSVELTDNSRKSPLLVDMPWAAGVENGVTKVHFTKERMTIDLEGLMHKPTLKKLIPQVTYTVEVVKGIDLKAASWPPVNLTTEVARLALSSALTQKYPQVSF